MDSIGADMETAIKGGEHRQLYQLVKQLSGKFHVDAPPFKGRVAHL